MIFCTGFNFKHFSHIYIRDVIINVIQLEEAMVNFQLGQATAKLVRYGCKGHGLDTIYCVQHSPPPKNPRRWPFCDFQCWSTYYLWFKVHFSSLSITFYVAHICCSQITYICSWHFLHPPLFLFFWQVYAILVL